MSTFTLPDLGEGLQEAELVAWHVNVGDHVVADQPLFSVETAKAVVEVPSPCSGDIARRFGEPGDIIKVGAPVVEFVEEGAEVVSCAEASEGSGDAGCFIGVGWRAGDDAKRVGADGHISKPG